MLSCARFAGESAHFVQGPGFVNAQRQINCEIPPSVARAWELRKAFQSERFCGSCLGWPLNDGDLCDDSYYTPKESASRCI